VDCPGSLFLWALIGVVTIWPSLNSVGLLLFHSAPPSSVAADVYVTRAQQARDSRPWPIHSPSHAHCPTVATVSGMAYCSQKKNKEECVLTVHMTDVAFANFMDVGFHYGEVSLSVGGSFRLK